VKRLEGWLDGTIGRLAGSPRGWVRLLPTFALVLARLVSHGIADPDLFARIALGRLIIRDGAVPLQDPFAFTPTKAVWYDHEWLSGLIFYGISRLGGDVALLLFDVLIAWATIRILHAAQRAFSVPPTHAAVWMFFCVAPILGGWLSVVRCHAFTFLLTAVFVLACLRYRATGRTIWLTALPLLMAAWVNLHGGFVVGLGCLLFLAVSFAIDHRRPVRPVVLCLLACLSMSLVNPYGPAYLRFMAEALTKDRRTITEWLPLDLVSAQGLVVLATVAALGFGVLRARRAVPLEGQLLLLLGLGFGLRHQRFIALFYLLAAVYGLPWISVFAQALREVLPRRFRALRRGVALALVGVLGWGGLSAAQVAWQGRQFSLHYVHSPVLAMEWLRLHRTGGKLLVHFDQGSYALWRGYPRFTVSLDGRYEAVYPDATVDLVDRVFRVTNPIHHRDLAQLAPDYILLCAVSSPRIDYRVFGPLWTLIYQDPACRLLGREPNADGRIGTPPEGRPDIWTPGF